jgi:hypothetical protein
MEIYTQLHSTLNINGRKVLVDPAKWGYYTMSHERFAEFFQDVQNWTNEFYNTRGFQSEFVYSSNAVDRCGNKILIGCRYIFEDKKIIIDKYEYWQNEMSNDPRVTYRPWVKENT